MDISATLVVAIASALVGLLCLWLFATALLRMGKVKKGKGSLGETAADLKSFALKQLLSAVVMFALAAFIYLYS